MIKRMRPKDKAVGLITDIAEDQRVCEVDCVNIRARRQDRRERVVMPVQNNDRVCAKNRVHRPRLQRIDAHSKKALPIAPCKRAAGAELLERSGG